MPRYVGSVEFIIESGVTRTRRYLAGGAVVTTASNLPGQVEDRWVLTDHLGSSDVVVNDAGAVVESTGFDAWGLRRNAGNATVPGTALATTTRGFTSHEHFDAIGLVHMNGRVYDPNLGRFIQSDPIDDRGIQGLNRYSYVLNNPLSLTDPTGHLSWGEWMRLGINIAITVATGDASGFAAYFAAGANGFMAGHLQSGTTKGGAWGAFSAITFHGIGSYFDGAEWAHQGQHVYGTNLNMGGFSAKVLAHGVTGGTVQHLQGGSFGSGFAAAGVTQAFSGAIDGINPAQPIGRFQRVMVAALVGGTASTISGGKFANGAVTAAFARAFNDELGTRARPSEFDESSLQEMLDHAYSILDRPAGPDGVKELSIGELHVVITYEAMALDQRSAARGGYANLLSEEFGLELYNRGDSIFFGPESAGGYGGTSFRIVGAPPEISGTFVGGDINYVYQGLMQGARGNTLRQVHDSVISWNISQGNVGRIPQRLAWATYGFDYYRSRP